MLYVNPLEGSQMARANNTSRQSLRQKQSLQEYERVFLYQLLREMRKTVSNSGLFGKSREQEFFQETLDDVLAGKMAESGQLGIAKQIEAQLLAAGQAAANSGKKWPDEGLPLRPQAAAGLPLPSAAAYPLPPRTMEGIPLFGRRATPLPLSDNR